MERPSLVVVFFFAVVGGYIGLMAGYWTITHVFKPMPVQVTNPEVYKYEQ